jgi:hypothetical protein
MTPWPGREKQRMEGREAEKGKKILLVQLRMTKSSP